MSQRILMMQKSILYQVHICVCGPYLTILLDITLLSFL